MLYVSQGESKLVELFFTNNDSSVINLSGSSIFFGAKRSYTDTSYLISKTITGHYAPESGLSRMYLTTGDTNLCPGDYLAAFKLTDISGLVSVFDASGLMVFPSI
jgi:hypothetical protein